MSLICCYVPLAAAALAARVSSHAVKHSGPSAAIVQGWITAIATAGLLIGAFFTALYARKTVLYARKAFREQSKEVAILVRESERQADERRIAQAAQVFTGSPQPAGAGAGTVPYAENASDLPIYDAKFWYPGVSGVPGGLSAPDELGVIMPRKKIRGTGSVIYSSRELAVSDVILTFRDAAGVRWIRMPDGALNQQSCATARQSVLAALEHNLPDGYERQDDQITGSVVDAIVVNPRSHGELRMPGEYSSSLDLSAKVNRPPEREVTLTSEDGSTQGVYCQSRSIGPLERFTLVWDVWNHRDSRVFARLILTGQENQGQPETS
jgi:hypothetical protein